LHDYQVDAVREIRKGLVEVTLRPLGRGMTFVPGQFAMVYVEAKDGWHRHPFTISSAPREEILRFTVKGRGDYTSRLPELIEPGMPAVIGGPHGRFDHRRGTDRQIWIAGGVGVAPFLSWLRALDAPPPHRVEFFYTADGAPPFADEIQAIADRYPSLHSHVIDSNVEGRLTLDRVLADVDGSPRGLSVFMCGPTGMLNTFQTELRKAGVPARQMHRESFDWR
jgi:predicted ferric reductase